MKYITNEESLRQVEEFLLKYHELKVFERAEHTGDYREKVVVDVPWDKEKVCRNFIDNRAWEKYANRGIPETTQKVWTICWKTLSQESALKLP